MKRRVVAGIYIIVSPSGRVYVGQSLDVFTRWRSHRTKSRTNGRTLSAERRENMRLAQLRRWERAKGAGL